MSTVGATVAVVSDAESFSLKLIVIRSLSSSGYRVLDLGVYEKDEEYTYEELARRAANEIREAKCIGCIAASLTGNSIQIYANKYDQIVAAPCDSLARAKEAVKEIAPNMCDIYSRLPVTDIPRVVSVFASAFAKRYFSSNGGARQ